MAGFAIAAGNRSQPLSAVYAASAATVNAICGDGFVNATAVSPSGESLARGSLTGSAAGRVVGWTGWVGVGVGVGIVLVLG